MGSAGLCSKHRKDSSATPNIQDGLALEKMRIVHDGGAIRAGANRVLQHLLMDTCDPLTTEASRVIRDAGHTEVCVRVRIAGRWQIGIVRTKSKAG